MGNALLIGSALLLTACQTLDQTSSSSTGLSPNAPAVAGFADAQATPPALPDGATNSPVDDEAGRVVIPQGGPEFSANSAARVDSSSSVATNALTAPQTTPDAIAKAEEVASVSASDESSQADQASATSQVLALNAVQPKAAAVNVPVAKQETSLSSLFKKREKKPDPRLAQFSAPKAASAVGQASKSAVAKIGRPFKIKPVKFVAAKSSDVLSRLNMKARRWDCVPPKLQQVIWRVIERYGEVRINSTVRDPLQNRSARGRSKSYHLSCQAVDFRVLGPHKGLYAFLRGQPEVGGLKRYRSGFYHIDTGPKRSW